MNGAMAELCAKKISNPKSSNTRIIGVNHHHLCCQKKERSSPIIPMRVNMLSKNHIQYLDLFFNYIVSQHKNIHSTAAKSAKGFLRGVDNRFAFQVEGGVQNNRNSCGLPECVNQLVVARVDFFPNRLQSSCAVNMSDGGNHILFLFTHVYNV